jgi:hypothetical protein
MRMRLPIATCIVERDAKSRIAFVSSGVDEVILIKSLNDALGEESLRIRLEITWQSFRNSLVSLPSHDEIRNAYDFSMLFLSGSLEITWQTFTRSDPALFTAPRPPAPEGRK